MQIMLNYHTHTSSLSCFIFFYLWLKFISWVVDVPQLDVKNGIPQQVKDKITATWRKRSELECIANDVGYQEMMSHFNTYEREHVMLEGMMLEIITQQHFLNELNEKYKAKKYQVKRLKKQLKLKSVRDSLKNGPCKEYCPHCGKLLTNWYNYREHVSNT